MIVTISGLPGTDAREICKQIALEFNLQYVSLEQIGKGIALPGNAARVSEMLKAAVHRKNCIVEHALAGIMLSNADAKIFLLSFRLNRAKMLSRREKTGFDAALVKIEGEEEILRKIASGELGAEIDNLNCYDLVLNSDKIMSNDAAELIKNYIKRAVA
ncbi:MAG: hypothetical protein J4415_02630 [Candidatus Diapherotrites archaeon]|uniref:Cytidylate kinase n=1 Tax=Candidatus Iainarchaeum sp. TaxID=3101447 RepID=A0A8T4KT06_9ARCH|nr:hypothetical protein [Candidatus Diapherotrites archaeon]